MYLSWIRSSYIIQPFLLVARASSLSNDQPKCHTILLVQFSYDVEVPIG